MHILLATGIFPPAIGGPATYSTKLAEEFLKLGHSVTVVTYGRELKIDPTSLPMELRGAGNGKLKIIFIRKTGGVIARWMRYRKALKKYAHDADAVIALSSVSTGIPLLLSGLKKPKKILRLGGDFFWERYTDAGGMQSLREWYTSRFGFWRIINTCLMEAILRSFDHIVYSTEFQKKIHEHAYAGLPQSTVIENAIPFSTPTCAPAGALVGRPHPSAHHPLRLLFMGRFVGFKNLPTLLDAVESLHEVSLTLVGCGPFEGRLRARASLLGLGSRVEFHSPVLGEEKRRMFLEHDVLILPSVTEISPNVALEAASGGLPVLLTEETGLKQAGNILLKPLREKNDIIRSIREYMEHADAPKSAMHVRTYAELAQDWVQLLASL